MCRAPSCRTFITRRAAMRCMSSPSQKSSLIFVGRLSTRAVAAQTAVGRRQKRRARRVRFQYNDGLRETVRTIPQKGTRTWGDLGGRMAETGASARKLTMDDIRAAAERLKNWGRWGAEDEVGTLNFTRPEDIVAAARLVQKGKVMSLALAYDSKGPQGGKTNYPALGRFNPIHVMTRTGTDAYSGVLDHRKIRAADDILIMPLQCGTQWDGLGHIFYGDHMWNGYDCRMATSAGAQKG